MAKLKAKAAQLRKYACEFYLKRLYAENLQT